MTAVETPFKRWLLLKKDGGYPFGVIARTKKDWAVDELHGPFDTKEEAKEFIKAMRREYTDYVGFDVVKIEVPGA